MNDTSHSTPDLDRTDLAILERVEQDYDVSLETIADDLEISKSSVHYRLKKLKDNEVIQRITADVDSLVLGLKMVAITDVSVTHKSGYSEHIGEKLTALDGVEQVYYTMGDVDFMVISRVQSREQLNDLIDQIVDIEGVNQTSSRFVMREFKTNRSLLSNLSEEMQTRVLES